VESIHTELHYSINVLLLDQFLCVNVKNVTFLYGWLREKTTEIHKSRVHYRFLDNEVSCQQLFCHIRPAI